MVFRQSRLWDAFLHMWREQISLSLLKFGILFWYWGGVCYIDMLNSIYGLYSNNDTIKLEQIERSHATFVLFPLARGSWTSFPLHDLASTLADYMNPSRS